MCLCVLPHVDVVQGVKLGGSYKLDADTTVNGTADQDAKLSLAYKQKLNSFATLAISGQVDASDLGSDKHKFGLTLTLSSSTRVLC